MAGEADEGDWVRLARTGDRAAFAALVERYWDRLRGWLYSLTGSVQSSEDLTQEAFVRAWAGLARLQSASTFRVWLFRIARNCYLDQQRGERRREGRRQVENLASTQAGPVESAIRREAEAALKAALAGLPLHYREAYLLWTREDLPYGQIAEILAISEETARWRVCKARRLLFDAMRPYLDQVEK